MKILRQRLSPLSIPAAWLYAKLWVELELQKEDQILPQEANSLTKKIKHA